MKINQDSQTQPKSIKCDVKIYTYVHKNKYGAIIESCGTVLGMKMISAYVFRFFSIKRICLKKVKLAISKLVSFYSRVGSDKNG